MKSFQIKSYVRCRRTGCAIRTIHVVRGPVIVAQHITMSTPPLDVVPVPSCEDYSTTRDPRRFANGTTKV